MGLSRACPARGGHGYRRVNAMCSADEVCLTEEVGGYKEPGDETAETSSISKP